MLISFITHGEANDWGEATTMKMGRSVSSWTILRQSVSPPCAPPEMSNQTVSSLPPSAARSAVTRRMPKSLSWWL
jgi:hypothetical protein